MQPDAVGATDSRTAPLLAPGWLCASVVPLNGHCSLGDTGAAVTVVTGPVLSVAVFELELHADAVTHNATAHPATSSFIVRMSPPSAPTSSGGAGGRGITPK